jgi:glutamyl-tRNA synthetase
MTNKTSTNTVRTRMAPSPTGELHVGSLATALKNYAYAKKHNGQFVLRIEDTDKTREVENGVELLQKVFRDFGLNWDEGPEVGGKFGPYIQSERLELYQEKAQQLIDSGHAYYCFCSSERLEKVRDEQRKNKVPPKYDKKCRKLDPAETKKRVDSGESHVIRLKVPDNQDISFNDWIRGDISVNSNVIDDQVLIKSDGFPTYHMGVVVDDHLMQITHVFRGEEWISSTPKHILLYKAYGWELPEFAHIPVYLNPDGKGKMSKRKGDVSAQSFLEKGYLPEALLNFLMILGWARDDEVEIMSMDEYIEEFDPRDLSSKPVAFDIKKLNWINGVYIRKLSIEELSNKLVKFLPNNFPKEKLNQILPLIQDRLEVLTDIVDLTDFFCQTPTVEAGLLLKKSDSSEVKNQLELTKKVLGNIDDKDWGLAQIEKEIRNLQESNDWKRGQYFMMLRIAATGKKATPPLFETIEVIGKKEIVDRFDNAIKLVE